MKILLASDGSDFSLAAAGKMCEFIDFRAGSKILILSVAEPVRPSNRFAGYDEYLVLAQKAAFGAATAAAGATLEEVMLHLGTKKVEVETKVEEGNPKTVIVDAAKKWQADLVVTGSHGRGFWGRMLIGSVSDAVVKHSPCSVLIVRT